MVGSGGDGVVTAGDMVLNAVAEEGLFALSGKSFGPQIRGGESSMRVRIATEPVENTGSGLDYLVVLNWRDYGRFSGELNMAPNGVILCEADAKAAIQEVPEHCRRSTIVEIPFQKMAEEAGARRAKNVLTLGVFAGLANLPKERFLSSIEKKFKRKGDEVLQMNREAFLAGYEKAQEVSDDTWPQLSYENGERKMVIDGNQAVAAAAIAAGCRFFAGYPITPSTEVMQWLTNELPRFGGKIVQAEDEISAMAHVCGASFAGAKAMTTTSGPGLSLKTELIGMATMAELPCVIVDVQRGGPSTGLPTKGEQGDLYQALFSAHGDAPRPVLAAYDALSLVRVVFEAFAIAENYQTPVIVLSDGFMAQGKQVCAAPDLSDRKRYPVSERREPTPEELAAGYQRFKLTDDFISPMSRPGMEGGNYLASGIEHDEVGRPVSDASFHETMNHKRLEKLQPIRERDDLVLTFGDEDATDALITWGYSTGAVREALEMLRAEGRKIKLLVPLLLSPLPLKTFETFLTGVEQLAVVELNYMAQLAHYLRMELDLPEKTHYIKRSGGAVWQPEELVMRLNESMFAKQRAGAAA
jgi:2-oxoglutarate ferredoxin oxidoreductase subunit alpha